jgi:hypothetical protein
MAVLRRLARPGLPILTTVPVPISNRVMSAGLRERRIEANLLSGGVARNEQATDKQDEYPPQIMGPDYQGMGRKSSRGYRLLRIRLSGVALRAREMGVLRASPSSHGHV